jgi:uncharacterized membrane protein HdeD (DUF308 family)
MNSGPNQRRPRRKPPLAGPRLLLAIAALVGGVIAVAVAFSSGSKPKGELIAGIFLIVAGIVHLVILAIQGGLS